MLIASKFPDFFLDVFQFLNLSVRCRIPYKLRNRKTVHIQQVRDPLTRQMPLSAHLDTCFNTYQKFSIFPFFKMQNDNVSARLSKEEYFIKIYKPKLNVK